MASLRSSLRYEPVELGFGTSGLRALVADMTDLECYINVAGFLQFLRDSEQIGAGEAVYVAGDLRESTPRILAAVVAAIRDGGYIAENCGLIPTPAVALWGLHHKAAAIMVTGSHIPADRNGIKFNKPDGEVMKPDEAAIKKAVAVVRAQMYEADAAEAAFDEAGAFKRAVPVPRVEGEGRAHYLKRYMDVFAGAPFAGKTIVYYQHSAVGRDLLVELFEALGAKVVPVGRSEVFIPIDSENVTEANRTYFAELAAQNPGLFAILSTDGDSDRPFVIDEMGVFHRGDELGAVVSAWLGADFAAYPVSTNDAVDSWLTEKQVPWVHTRIGSPYVIAAMNEARAQGKKAVVGWEVNGGFLIDTELEVHGAKLAPLATRDAALPMIVALMAAVEQGKKVSEVFEPLPKRYTQAGLIDNFPVEVSKALVARLGKDTPEVRAELATYFGREHGFGDVTAINALDGVRISFDNGDVAHLRPSGNAPQLRIYSVADTQARADEIAAMCLAEPDGIFRKLERVTR